MNAEEFLGYLAINGPWYTLTIFWGCVAIILITGIIMILAESSDAIPLGVFASFLLILLIGFGWLFVKLTLTHEQNSAPILLYLQEKTEDTSSVRVQYQLRLYHLDSEQKQVYKTAPEAAEADQNSRIQEAVPRIVALCQLDTEITSKWGRNCVKQHLSKYLGKQVIIKKVFVN